MNHRGILLTLCVLCCAVLSMQALAGGPYKLRMGMKEGKTYIYGDLVKADVTQEMMGQEMKTSSVSRTVTRLAIEKADASAISAMQSLDSSVVSVKNPRMDTVIVNPDVIGKRTRITLSTLGKVLKRAVIDSINTPNGPMRGGSIRDAMRAHILPEAPVSVGGTWNGSMADTNEAMGGKLVTATTLTYTLVGEEQKAGYACVKITFTGTTTIEGKGSGMGMEIFTEGKGTVGGTLWFDVAAGVTVTEEVKLESEMTAAVTGQQSMTIPMSSVGSSTRVLRSVQDTK
jgi:hypothetical protein